MSISTRRNLTKPDIGTAGAGHSWGVSATGSFGLDLTCFCLVHEVCFRRTGVLPVKNTAIPWQPEWKPRVWQPGKVVTTDGNCAGNYLSGSRQHCEPKARTSVRTTSAELCPLRTPECVPEVRTGLRTDAGLNLPPALYWPELRRG